MLNVGQFTPQQKLLFNAKRVTDWLDGQNVYPILVELDLTNKCNHGCSFCTFRYIKDRSTLETPIVLRTIDELSAGGVKAINWTGGGEPLLHKDFKEIAYRAKFRGIEQGLFTNGALFTDETITAIVDTHTWVRFSIDAGTAKTYAKLRQVDDFNKVVEKVRQAVEKKRELSSKCSIGIGFVITPENYKEIPLFNRLILDTGADYGQFKPCIHNYMEEQIEASWWRDKVKPLLEDACSDNPRAVVNLYKFNDISNNIGRFYEICYGHQFCPCIGATGDVWLCTHMRDISGYSCGNLHDKTFDDIWNGKQRKKAVSGINFKNCQFGCKNNEINKILYQLKHPSPDGHYNFL